MKKILLTALFSTFFISHLQATIVIGDSSAPNDETFSFEVGHAKFSIGDNQGRRLWYASGEDLSTAEDNVKKFGLGYIIEIKAEPTINPITLELIKPIARPLANQEDAKIYTWTGSTVTSSTVTNPIYGSSFDFFSITNNKPSFVVNNNRANLYHTHDIKHFDTQTDTNKNTTELLIHNVDPSGTNNEIVFLTSTVNNIVIAFAPSGNWGSATSGIQKLIPAHFELEPADKDNKKPATTAPYLNPSEVFEVSTSTAQLLGGGTDLSNLGTDITLKNKSENIYVGLNISTNAGSQGTAMTILTGTTTLNALKILPDTVVASGIDTVLSIGENKSLRIKNIAFMRTSTGLEYMIVSREQGILGDFSISQQTIYAVPLVSTGINVGRIADFTNTTNLFQGINSTFSHRHFDTLISNADQIDPTNITYQEQLLVGQAAPPITGGNIKDLYTVGDSVYIVIDQAYGPGTQPGTFYSQAIFTTDGQITSWTPWARVLGTDTETKISYVNGNSTTGFYLSKGSTSGKFSSIYQTQWHNNDNLHEFTSRTNFFPGGTQGLFNFPQSTIGFNNAMSLLIGTGYNSVILGQTGHVNGQFKINTMSSSDVIQPDSDNLNHRALIAAEIAHNGIDHWLFVGGASGVSVLTDGTGVTKTNDFSSVADFNIGQTWKKVGNFSLVKKLVWDNTYIYILTNTHLYRIELNASFKSDQENPIVETVLTTSQLYESDYLLDIIINDNFCILGTTNGMYSFDSSTGTATNISKITIPNGLPAITQLYTISNGAESQRSFKDKSNLYVLNNKFGTQQAHINRFAINNSIITPFNDQFLSGINTSFINFNNYITNYFTNGSWNLASQYFLGATQPESTISPSVLQIFAGVQNGYSSTHKIMTYMYSSLVPTSFINNTDNILGVLRESTSGALIMSGNFQSRVNA